jgi:hypothetical protein
VNEPPLSRRLAPTLQLHPEIETPAPGGHERAILGDKPPHAAPPLCHEGLW